MPRKTKLKGGATVISNDILKIDIANGQAVQTSPGSLVYMRGDIEKGEVNVGSMKMAFARSFGAENFFLTRYVGGPKGGTIALSLSIPGDIVQLVLKPNDKYRISKGCFLASTDNVNISATIQTKGLIEIGQEEGAILPLVSNDSDSDGIAWLGGFGSFEKHELKDESDVLVVDNGIFLACPNEMQYNIVKLGKSLWSSAMGGEGFGMEFRGPGVVYTQSKNFNEFIANINTTAAPRGVTSSMTDTMKQNTGEALGNAITGWMSSEGGKARSGGKSTHKKTAAPKKQTQYKKSSPRKK